MRRDREAEQALPETVRADIPGNGLRLVSATALQSSGDQIVNAATVLPWLLHALGAPLALTGVLVPIRESGSMLPQAMLTPLILRVRYRKWVFVTGALIQAAAVAVMTATAAVGHGLGAGLVIVAALTVFSLGRCLSSVSSKDVLGRTVPPGQRGQINGLATFASGLVAVTVGLGIRVLGGEDLSAGQLAWLLGAGALLWVVVAVVYADIREPAGEAQPEPADGTGDQDNWFVETVTLLRDDRPFRRFVSVRSLLLVSALSPPFVVALSVRSGVTGLEGLGGFVIASGVAALLGGFLFGRWADRSSRTLMIVGAAVASAIIIALVLSVWLLGFTGGSAWGTMLFVISYLLITLVHTGVRVGRKTYIVDMATGDQRTRYVAVSNTAMGVILLIVGAVSSLLAAVSLEWALLLLAAMGLVGVFAAARLPEVSRHRS